MTAMKNLPSLRNTYIFLMLTSVAVILNDLVFAKIQGYFFFTTAIAILVIVQNQDSQLQTPKSLYKRSHFYMRFQWHCPAKRKSQVYFKAML